MSVHDSAPCFSAVTLRSLKQHYLTLLLDSHLFRPPESLHRLRVLNHSTGLELALLCHLRHEAPARRLLSQLKVLERANLSATEHCWRLAYLLHDPCSLA